MTHDRLATRWRRLARGALRAVVAVAAFAMGIGPLAPGIADARPPKAAQAGGSKRSTPAGKKPKGAGTKAPKPKGGRPGKPVEGSASAAAAPAQRRASSHGAAGGARGARPDEGAESEPSAPIAIDLAIRQAVLDSGLRVVTSVDRSAPIVTIATAYDAGSRRDEKGRSGLARLVARALAVAGTENLAPGEAARLVAERGGRASFDTTPDRTVFATELPANELALGLWIEAERMRSARLDEAAWQRAHTELETDAHANTGALRATGFGAWSASDESAAPAFVALRPSNRTRLYELVFQGHDAYEQPTAGRDPLGLDAGKAFHARCYGPASAVLVVAGDIDPDETMALVHRSFDAIPRREAPPFDEPRLPEQTSQRTAVVHDPIARTTGILYAWALPAGRHADEAALAIAAEALAGGDDSRLGSRLMRAGGLVVHVAASVERRRGPGAFVVEAAIADPAKVGHVEKAIEAELKDLATRPMSAAELARARRRLEARRAQELANVTKRALRLAEAELLFGGARELELAAERLGRVTADDVKRVAAQHLGPTRRTIVEIYPAAGQEPPPLPPRAQRGTGGGGSGAHRATSGARAGDAAPSPSRGQEAAPAAKAPPAKKAASPRPKPPAATVKPKPKGRKPKKP